MTDFIPTEAQKFLLVLLLSFLIGLEREEHKGDEGTHYVFGGIRTFPLFGVLGYAAALLSPGQPIILGAGFLVVGALMVAAYLHKVQTDSAAGMTSEVSGALAYLVGAIVYEQHYWIATALVVSCVLLLELKTAMETAAQRISPVELLTFTKFLLLTAVFFPILPDVPLTQFQINPRHTWMIVVAISSLSYGSYILQKFIGERGTLMSGIIGGAYSSTIATVALAKQSRGSHRPHLFAGAILSASGVMYLRLAILVSVFSTALRLRLAPELLALGVIGIAAGTLWTRRAEGRAAGKKEHSASRNPLEIRAALFFAVLFLVMTVLTHFVLQKLGTPGVYGLSVITGVTDVDPFIMSLTQSAGLTTPELTAAIAILIAASSNNIMKGFYALSLADRDTGRQSFAALLGLALLGLATLPILLIAG